MSPPPLGGGGGFKALDYMTRHDSTYQRTPGRDIPPTTPGYSDSDSDEEEEEEKEQEAVEEEEEQLPPRRIATPRKKPKKPKRRAKKDNEDAPPVKKSRDQVGDRVSIPCAMRQVLTSVLQRKVAALTSVAEVDVPSWIKYPKKPQRYFYPKNHRHVGRVASNNTAVTDALLRCHGLRCRNHPLKVDELGNVDAQGLAYCSECFAEQEPPSDEAKAKGLEALAHVQHITCLTCLAVIRMRGGDEGDVLTTFHAHDCQEMREPANGEVTCDAVVRWLVPLPENEERVFAPFIDIRGQRVPLSFRKGSVCPFVGTLDDLKQHLETCHIAQNRLTMRLAYKAACDMVAGTQ